MPSSNSLTILFLVSHALILASSDTVAQQLTPTPKQSANYEKTDKFLPGEEVVGPTGQKMKVWSTEGPVPVSRAPEPFEDREKSILNPNTPVVIDADTKLPRGDSSQGNKDKQ